MPSHKKIRGWARCLVWSVCLAAATLIPVSGIQIITLMPMVIHAADNPVSVSGKDPSLDRLFSDEREIIRQAGDGPLDEAVKLSLASVRQAHAMALFKFYENSQRLDALELALIYANSAQALNPVDPKINLLVGIIYSEFQDSPFAGIKAIQSFERAVDVTPGLGTARILLANAYLRENFHAEALEQFEEALWQDSSLVSPETISAMTLCYVLLGKSGEDFYRQLLRRHPDKTYLALSRAVLLKHDQRLAEATQELNRVINSSQAGIEDKKFAGDLIRAISASQGER
jgi:tetratricopeptide (TPR) repeat protein